MTETSLPRLTRILGELLAASVRTPLPAHTRRRIFGPAGLPGKATAIVGRHGRDDVRRPTSTSRIGSPTLSGASAFRARRPASVQGGAGNTLTRNTPIA